ncbi:MAG: SCO family protein [Gammaproteobacteria bacterium]
MTKDTPKADTRPPLTEAQRRAGRLRLLMVLLVCASPMIFSYLTYYVIKPTGRTNYGTLIDPRNYPIPPMAATTLDGKPSGLDAFKGKWVMLKVGPAECGDDCRRQLVAMRQLRLMQGKEMERIERVWLVTDAAPLDTMLMREHDGVRILRAPREVVEKWLPVEQGGQAFEHIYMIDPLGNLMMRWPKEADDTVENAGKVKKDIGKLLKASAIG